MQVLKEGGPTALAEMLKQKYFLEQARAAYHLVSATSPKTYGHVVEPRGSSRGLRAPLAPACCAHVPFNYPPTIVM